MSDRVLRFPDRTWDELEGLPQPLRNAAHKVIFHLLEEPVPALADPFPEADPLPGAYRLHLPADDTADAEHLMHLTWDQMIDPQNPFFTGTMWENIGPDGTATEARTSLAHGWASGPTPILTGYVLGIQPVKPGYQTFTVTPHPGNLRWGRGRGPDSVRADTRPVDQGWSPVLADGRGTSPVHGLHSVARRAPRHPAWRPVRDYAHLY